MTRTLFFCGIGGSGMAPLAYALAARGIRVAGSDRSRDAGKTPEKFAAMERAGIGLFPQDGTGLSPGLDALVVSSAIEESIPDVRAARNLGVPVRRRAEILAELFEGSRGVGVGGTSGKTTVTGMIATLFAARGLDPTVVNGGVMLDFGAGWRGGAGEWIVAEMDESDGSIDLFSPDIAVLNNITLDHKPVEALRPMFQAFLDRARLGQAVNLDDPEAAALRRSPACLTFGIDNGSARLNASRLDRAPGSVAFDVVDRENGRTARCALAVPGRHNVSNALAAMGAGILAGISLDHAAAALGRFKGIARRLEVVGRSARGVTVIDDFAHNPDKIAASLATLAEEPGRTVVMFQPHGFGPMRMMRAELAEAFARGLRPGDALYMPEIFYAGGTAARDISSADLAGDVAALGHAAFFTADREEAARRIVADSRPGDRIVVMGARDDTLSDYARALLAALA